MIKNKKEFKALVERYETIGLEEIKEAWDSIISSTQNYSGKYGIPAARELTGFGSMKTCVLCISVKNKCSVCVYSYRYTEDFGCINEKNYPTFEGIKTTDTPEELLEAFRKRAEHLRTNYAKHLV